MGARAVRAVLDTSVLIASWRPSESVEHAISVASLAELHFGVLKATGTPNLAARIRRLSEIEREFDPIPISNRVARSYAQCAHAVTLTGRSPRPRVFDLLIAATAMEERAVLYTFNAEDFRGLEDLVEIVTPPP